MAQTVFSCHIAQKLVDLLLFAKHTRDLEESQHADPPNTLGKKEKRYLYCLPMNSIRPRLCCPLIALN